MNEEKDIYYLLMNIITELMTELQQLRRQAEQQLITADSLAYLYAELNKGRGAFAAPEPIEGQGQQGKQHH